MILRMNSFKKIVPLAAVVLWVGCDTLDFADPNSPVVESATIQSLVTGAEAGMRVDLDIYLRNIGVVGREVYYLEPADPRYTGELLRGPLDPGGFLTTRPWNAHYRVIKNCNLLLERTDTDAGVRGFAKTILAYNLLLVINMQDENGARTNYDGNINVSVATKTEVFAEIESLLEGGYDDLQDAGGEFSFVLSSGFDGFDSPASTFAEFNRALAARVAVYDDRWQDALDALAESFLDESGDLDEGVFHVFSSGLNDQESEMYEDPTATFVKLLGHPTFETDAEDGDARFSSKVTVREASLPVITYDDLTSNLAPIMWSSGFDPVSIIRNEELILLQAEANIGLGDYDDAQTDMNIVREAAGLDAYTDTDAGNALDRLLYEKRYSLFLEGHRLIDMRHYNKLDDLPLDRDGDAIVTFPLPETETPG
ncbi:MAG: RagB/SusD family nutrient uptake outer membrane protein [Candidatus Neomarinimicrobiota bacterium]